jgi:adenylylsulfate kinase-like enzyme
MGDMTQPDKHQGNPESRSLASRLKHVCWIGGASGAGKSTTARRLATKHAGDTGQ